MTLKKSFKIFVSFKFFGLFAVSKMLTEGVASWPTAHPASSKTSLKLAS